MRALTLFVISSVCGIGVMCGQVTESGKDGTGARALAAAPEDDDDSRGDTALGSGAPAPVRGDDDPGDDATSEGTREACVEACKGGPATRARFCELIIPAMYTACRKRVEGSTAACVAWCFWSY